jgi:hypothetical protein
MTHLLALLLVLAPLPNTRETDAMLFDALVGKDPRRWTVLPLPRARWGHLWFNNDNTFFWATTAGNLSGTWSANTRDQVITLKDNPFGALTGRTFLTWHYHESTNHRYFFGRAHDHVNEEDLNLGLVLVEQLDVWLWLLSQTQ